MTRPWLNTSIPFSIGFPRIVAIQRARILTIGSDDIPVVPIMAPFRSMILDSQFYSQSTLQVARQLLGKLLVRQLGDTRLSGVIVEVESYLSAMILRATPTVAQ